MKILIVEDDEDIRQVLHDALKLSGYSITTAEHGESALHQLSSQPHPDLILLDLMMPVMTGWELMESLRKDSALTHIPIIVLSAASDSGFKNIQPTYRLKKPVDLDLLLETIKKCCGTT